MSDNGLGSSLLAAPMHQHVPRGAGQLTGADGIVLTVEATRGVADEIGLNTQAGSISVNASIFVAPNETALLSELTALYAAADDDDNGEKEEEDEEEEEEDEDE